jgi:hypothetical protein
MHSIFQHGIGCMESREHSSARPSSTRTFSVTSPSDSSRQELHQAPRRPQRVEPHRRRAIHRHLAIAIAFERQAPSRYRTEFEVGFDKPKPSACCSPLEPRRVLSPPSAQSFPRARRNYTPTAHVLRGRHRIDRPQETLLRARATYLTHSSSL